MRKTYIVLALAILTIGLVTTAFFNKKNPPQVLSLLPVSDINHPESTSFVVVIPSYNNSSWCERNLRSVFEQSYHNYRIIYIDDASTDGTYEKVKQFVESSGKSGQVTLNKNPSNQGAMFNFYEAIHTCKDNEVVVVLDGDDWLAHDGVLSTLNKYYSNPNVWATHGSYVHYPSYTKGECARKVPRKVVLANAFRSYTKKGFILSHLRSFYAGLFKMVPREQFEMEGVFYKSAADLAMMFPLAELAGQHFCFIKEVLYVYNRSSPLNDDKVRFELQQRCMRHIQNQPRLNQLHAKPY